MKFQYKDFNIDILIKEEMSEQRNYNYLFYSVVNSIDLSEFSGGSIDTDETIDEFIENLKNQIDRDYYFYSDRYTNTIKFEEE